MALSRNARATSTARKAHTKITGQAPKRLLNTEAVARPVKKIKHGSGARMTLGECQRSTGAGHSQIIRQGTTCELDLCTTVAAKLRIPFLKRPTSASVIEMLLSGKAFIANGVKLGNTEVDLVARLHPGDMALLRSVKLTGEMDTTASDANIKRLERAARFLEHRGCPVDTKILGLTPPSKEALQAGMKGMAIEKLEVLADFQGLCKTKIGFNVLRNSRGRRQAAVTEIFEANIEVNKAVVDNVCNHHQFKSTRCAAQAKRRLLERIAASEKAQNKLLNDPLYQSGLIGMDFEKSENREIKLQAKATKSSQ